MNQIADTERELDRINSFGAKILSDANVDFTEWEMKEEEGAKVKPAGGYVEDVIKYFSGDEESTGFTLPWSKTHEIIRLRPGELSIWAGINGHGKSMLLNQIILDITLKQNGLACIASMEMRPKQTLARMARQAVGVEEPTEDYIRIFSSAITNLFLYDQMGTVSSQRMLAVIRYCREQLNITHFVIDSLMKCGLGSDDYNGQKSFLDKLSTYAKDTDMHIHLVAHMRKRDDEYKAGGKMDIKGAGEITDMADNVFLIRRNKSKEKKLQELELKGTEAQKQDEKRKPDTFLECTKQRNGEFEGTIALWFQARALQYVAKQTNQVIPYLG